MSKTDSLHYQLCCGGKFPEENIQLSWYACRLVKKAVSVPQKGDLVHVIGSIKNYKFGGSDGMERVSTEILVKQYDIK